MDRIRPAAVAGTFYPGDPQALRAEIDELLDGVGQPAPRLGHPKALIVPMPATSTRGRWPLPPTTRLRPRAAS